MGGELSNTAYWAALLDVFMIEGTEKKAKLLVSTGWWDNWPAASSHSRSASPRCGPQPSFVTLDPSGSPARTGWTPAELKDTWRNRQMSGRTGLRVQKETWGAKSRWSRAEAKRMSQVFIFGLPCIPSKPLVVQIPNTSRAVLHNDIAQTQSQTLFFDSTLKKKRLVNLWLCIRK